jgi:hypothetical protein
VGRGAWVLGWFAMTQSCRTPARMQAIGFAGSHCCIRCKRIAAVGGLPVLLFWMTAH